MNLKNNNYTLSKTKTNTFVANVFSLMFTALIISGIASANFTSDPIVVLVHSICHQK